MCVIAFKPKNTPINQQTIDDIWNANPHGAGIALIEPNKVTVCKGYTCPIDLHNVIKSLQSCPLAIHFRYATHGTISPQNTHPFVVTPHINEASNIFTETTKPVLLHNGIIPGFGNKQLSDTLHFTTSVLSQIQDIPTMKKLLLSTGSKYLLIENNKLHFIGKFERYQGLRVSNTYFAYAANSKNCPNDNAPWPEHDLFKPHYTRYHKD